MCAFACALHTHICTLVYIDARVGVCVHDIIMHMSHMTMCACHVMS